MDSMPANLLEGTPTQVFSSEFCKTFKNNCFVKPLQKDVIRFYHIFAV